MAREANQFVFTDDRNTEPATLPTPPPLLEEEAQGTAPNATNTDTHRLDPTYCADADRYELNGFPHGPYITLSGIPRIGHCTTPWPMKHIVQCFHHR